MYKRLDHHTFSHRIPPSELRSLFIHNHDSMPFSVLSIFDSLQFIMSMFTKQIIICMSLIERKLINIEFIYPCRSLDVFLALVLLGIPFQIMFSHQLKNTKKTHIIKTYKLFRIKNLRNIERKGN